MHLCIRNKDPNLYKLGGLLFLYKFRVIEFIGISRYITNRAFTVIKINLCENNEAYLKAY